MNQFTTFLHQRFTILEAVQITQRKTVKVGAHSAQATGAVCRVCQGDHQISQCDTFLNSDIAKRRELVASLRLCYNCLHEAHAARNCPSRKRCKLCGKKHNSMLHQASSNRAASSALPNPKQQISSLNAINSGVDITAVLLATARILVKDSQGTFILLRALVDQGPRVRSTVKLRRNSYGYHVDRQI